MAFVGASKTKTKQSDLCRADLHRHRPKWFTVLLFTILLSVGGIIVAIVFGATGKVFAIPTQSVLGNSIDTDTQLALLGFIGKVLDLIVTISLEHVAGLWITWRMVSSSSGTPNKGVVLADFELGQELTKPWKALGAFYKRLRFVGWTWTSLLRFLLAILASGCLTGLGLAVNTIGMPKERWYPPMSTALPMTTMSSIDWGIFWQRGAATFGAGNHSAAIQEALLAANTYEALMALGPGMVKTPYGWRDFSMPNPDVPPASMALNTRLNGTITQGFAWQGEVLADMFGYMQQRGDPIARMAIGMTGIVTLAVPTITVTCGDFKADEFLAVYNGQPWNGTVFTNSTLADRGQPAFQVSLKPQPSRDFAGSTCLLSVSRMLFPTAAWIINTNGILGDVAFSPDGYGESVNATGIPLPYEPVDTQMAQQLVIGLSIVAARFDVFVPGHTGVELLIRAARALRDYRPDFTTDTAAMAPILAHMTSHLISVAGWGYNHTENMTVDASLSQIRWQVYGSSPRLSWEWAASAILGVLLAFLLSSALVMFFLRISPGDWLKPAGMLVAANLSEKMASLEKSVGEDERSLSNVRFRLGKGYTSDTVSIVDGSSTKGQPAMGASYPWATRTWPKGSFTDV